MLRPTCADCNTELTCLKNEVILVHYLDNDKAKGIDILHFGDLWECKKCNYKVVLGLGAQILGIDIANPEVWLKKYQCIEVKR